jgi:MraZ protein
MLLAESLEQAKGYTVAQLNNIKRMLLAPAVESATDKQGRVLIAPTLRSYASLDRDLVVVGMQNKIEIWSQDTWLKVVSQSEKDYLAALDTLAVPGI